jgi:hypothetical protein
MGMSPAPETLARLILRHVTAGEEHPGASPATAELVHDRLRRGLNVFFGETGFDVLWLRALALASRSVAETGDGGADAPMLHAPGWSNTLSGPAPDESHAGVLAALTSFIGLLFTFVGAELGIRLLAQVWPELPLGAPNTSTEGGT